MVNDDVNDYTIKKPITITPDQNINDGIKIMEKNLIWDIPVVVNGFLLGLLHLHGALKNIRFETDKIVCIIPARLNSTRFPKKLLQKIENIEIVEHVRRKPKLITNLSEVYIATPDQEIANRINSYDW